MAKLYPQKFILIAIVVVLLAAPFGNEAHASEKGVVFASENIRLTAYFGDGFVRLVFSDGREMVLPQTISASGARYAEGSVVFWNKGNEAFLDLGDVTYEVRVVDRATDPWQKAKEAGVYFRAIGQEPGWLLEIGSGERLRLLLDYGDTEMTTHFSIVEINYITGTRTYRTAEPRSPLAITVTIQEQSCFDVMSGEGFTHAVTVKLSGTGATYKGCGRDL